MRRLLRRLLLLLSSFVFSASTGASCYLEFQRLCRASEVSLAEVQLALDVALKAMGDNVDAMAQTQATLELTHESLRRIASICR